MVYRKFGTYPFKVTVSIVINTSFLSYVISVFNVSSVLGHVCCEVSGTPRACVGFLAH